MTTIGSRILFFCLFFFSGLTHLQASEVSSGQTQFDELFFTPGGKYTKADIVANGNMTPSQKYQGAVPSKATAETGEKICPISSSKVHSTYTWVIGGKTYHFCTPSCIAEFVRMAKEFPEKIQEPNEYVKK